MVADFNKPVITDDYSPYTTAIREGIEALATHNFTGALNIPDGTRRFNETSKLFEKWNSTLTQWDPLDVFETLTDGSYAWCLATGTATSIVLDYSLINISTLTNGMELKFRATASGTITGDTDVEVRFNGVSTGNKDLKGHVRGGTRELGQAEIIANGEYIIRYDLPSDEWILEVVSKIGVSIFETTSRL